MTKLNYLALGVSTLLLGACGSPESASDQAVEETEGVFDPMVGTMDKARAVEDIANSRNEELNKRMEEAE
ncbi:MAG: hypothetical protein QF790_10835 [Gammaproteobacteria bacterium]|jgi:hypothetical protein|nr:hypothetical protein [Gammaproteobacteria bacterium]MDP6617650.1 hypothetical protein [Gammaproteobacteria bacterium]MDP6694527.1 hypothetical protein [Gammaproteobacteria bacterium]